VRGIVPTEVFRVRLVVLDWAGTAVDFGCFGPVDAFARAYAAHGVSVTDPEIRGPMGLAKKDHVREMLRDPAVAGRWRSAHGRDWTEADVESVYAAFVPHQAAAAADHAGLTPGLLDAVAAVRAAGRRIGTTTGYFRGAAESVRAVARRQGYDPEWNAIPEDVSAGRPAPWMMFRLMEAAGVYPPASVAKVGDTVPDMEEARNAGVWAVGVLASSSDIGLTATAFAALPPADKARRLDAARRRLEAAGAHRTIETLADLPAILGELDTRLSRGDRP
jgi:phosphonoacetaldehyde hydrolase